MTALIRYAWSEGHPVFAIVADDQGAAYAWGSEETAAFGDDRIDMLSADLDPTPATAEEWLSLASTALTHFEFEPEVEAATRDQGLETAREVLSQSLEEVSHSSALAGTTAQVFSEISQDYPSFASEDEDDGDVDPDAITNMVLQVLGPIDPEGPNGWILRAMDGEPRDGDENAFVDFAPGLVLTPDAAATETK